MKGQQMHQQARAQPIIKLLFQPNLRRQLCQNLAKPAPSRFAQTAHMGDLEGPHRCHRPYVRLLGSVRPQKQAHTT